MKPRLKSSKRKHTAKRSFAFLAGLSALSIVDASAATFQWRGGGTDTNWTTPSNWDSAGVALTGITGAHRLNINNAGAPEAVYTAAQGTTNYNGASLRGLVIGSGTLGSGSMRITGGKFSSVGSGAGDVLGNTSPNTATLIIDGGEYETGQTLAMGLVYGVTSTLTVNSGTATVPDIATNNAIGNINLNGGTLAMNRFVLSGGGGNTFLNFNGGTLKARMSTTAFYPTPSNGVAYAYVLAGGAVIDTNGFNITIARPLEQHATSTGGGLTKNGAGTLTLGAKSTITGAVVVNGGGLALPAASTSWTPSSFTHSGTALSFDLGVYNAANPAPLVVPTLTLNAADILVTISGSSIPVTSEIRLIDYGTKSGTGSLKLNVAGLPSNMVATLEENTVDGYYYLNVTSPSATTYNWSGASATPGTGQWDTSSLNWNTNLAAYAPPALVIFPSITGGGTVTIPADVSPISFTISNASGNPYTFAGAGKITGATGLTKSNTGIATFNGAAHNFSGPISITGGALVKKLADDTTGTITVAGDNISYVLDGGITDGAGQTVVISGRGITSSNYFFAGSAVQRGALQAQNGASTWQGNIVLASAAADPNRVGVQNGASLTLTGVISESVAGSGIVFRAGNVGDNITLAGPDAYTYTGQTQIFSGGASIILGASNKLPINTQTSLHSGGATVFDLNGFNQQFATLGGSAVGDAARILNNGASPSTLTIAPTTGLLGYYQGRLVDGTGVLSFVKSGAGTQVLANNNTYSGSTTINQGILELGDGVSSGSLNPASAITNNGTLSFNRNDTVTQGTHFATGISGTGSLVKGGAGALELNSANSYAGTTTVNSGTLSLVGAGTVGGGAVVLANGSTLDVSASSSATVSLPGGLAGTGTVNATGKTVSVGGSFTPVALSITGNAALASGATTSLVAGSSPSATSQVAVTGTLANAGTLAITAGSGVIFADGQTYSFFTATGGITAGFTSVSVGALPLSATSAGVWTASEGGLAFTYTEATGSLAVATAPVFTALQTWRQLYFGSTENTGSAADTADSDGDGLDNLMEYALATNPTVANANPVVITQVGSFLTLSYTARTPVDPALTYSVLGSSTLTDGFTPATGSTVAGSPTVYTDNVNVSTPGTRRFLRLSVTYTPAP